MALFSCQVTKIKRGQVQRAAAYRSGERTRDERTGALFNHEDRIDVEHKAIVLPEHLALQPEMIWAYDRERLWNEAEHKANRRDATVAREVLVKIPVQLYPDPAWRLVRDYSQDLANRYGCAVDATLHPPREDNAPTNIHAHMLLTHRVITPEGLGRITLLGLSHTRREALGLTPGTTQQELLWVREHWADRINETFRSAGLEDRVSHLSLAAQGINREPIPDLPRAVRWKEKKHGPTTAGNDLRAEQQERAEARERSPEELRFVLSRQAERRWEYALGRRLHAASHPKEPSWSQMDRDARKARVQRQRAAHPEQKKALHKVQGKIRRQRAGEHRQEIEAGRALQRGLAPPALKRAAQKAQTPNVPQPGYRDSEARAAYLNFYRPLHKQREREWQAESAAGLSLQRFLAPTAADEAARRWAASRGKSPDLTPPRTPVPPPGEGLDASRQPGLHPGRSDTDRGQERERHPEPGIPQRRKDFDHSL